MKFLNKKILTAALALAAVTPQIKAQETEFPEPTLLTPIPGLSVFYMFSVTWDYQALKPGSNITLSMTTPSGKVYSNKGYMDSVLEDDEGGVFGEAEIIPSNALSVSFYKQNEKGFKENGVYTFHIPEDAVRLNGVPNPETTITYKFGPQAKMKPATYSPEETDNLSVLTIIWGEEITYTRAAMNGIGGYLYYNDKETELYKNAFSIVDAEGNVQKKTGVELRVDLGLYIRKEEYGIYTFTLPGGMVTNKNQEINASQNFVISYSEDAGISVIKPQDGLFEVYGMDGKKLMTTYEMEKLKGLKKGIYIINGKRVMVK